MHAVALVEDHVRVMVPLRRTSDADALRVAVGGVGVGGEVGTEPDDPPPPPHPCNARAATATKISEMEFWFIESPWLTEASLGDPDACCVQVLLFSQSQ